MYLNPKTGGMGKLTQDQIDAVWLDYGIDLTPEPNTVPDGLMTTQNMILFGLGGFALLALLVGGRR